MIKSDLERLAHPSLGNFAKYYCFPKGTTFPYQVWLRVLCSCKQSKIKKFTIGIIAYILYRHYSFKYGISIDTNIRIGKGLCIMHGFGVTVNCRIIGDYFTIYQNTTVGSDKNNEVPTIGNNVTIYTGAVVIGNIIINDNSVIGANAFVNKDVPTNSIVVGIPAKPIDRLNK